MTNHTTGGRTGGAVRRLGFFGLLGAHNLGNEGSFEALLTYLRRRHPDVELAAFCAGPERIEDGFGVPAVSMHWYREGRRPKIPAKAFGKVADVVRTFRWVGTQDAVVIPGMGVLEATLPVRPWGFPYALLLLCAFGRLRDTKIALVCVGASDVRQPVTRRLIATATRLATYRSFRDELSRDALTRMGVDTSADRVYPDLAFALPTPVTPAGDVTTVGVGVMNYRGTSLDTENADRIFTTYVTRMRRFVSWLVDAGYQVRLFTGDPVDDEVVDAIRADHDDRVTAATAVSYGELMRKMAAVDVVVASRYHNVLSALKLAKPTISVSYAEKNDVLMAGMGVGEYCQSIRTLDVDLLAKQFDHLVARRVQLRNRLLQRNQTYARRLDDQFAALSAALF